MSLLLLLTGEQTSNPTTDLELLYKPIRDDIARLLRNRLFAGGGRISTFTDETDPTADEVNQLIDDAASDVADKAGISLPDDTHPMARRVVTLGTAMLIEIGSEDFDQDRYDRLKALYDARLTELVKSAQDENEGGEAGGADDRASPVGSFPAGGTRWDREQF